MTKLTSTTGLLISIALLMLTGCTTGNTARLDNADMLTSTPVFQSAGNSNHCAAYDEEIEATQAYADKLSRSRYAVYYQAMSREKIMSIQQNARKAGCFNASTSSNQKPGELALNR